ncbi:HTH-type transcriptional regulator PksA [Halobacillus andaensis]|uniref:HTH-type transcriptional regulator PksA n=1 Tax=Halobacillus andaensis TaxID=1176239 RepID=A0A917EVS0_HALAA|nr:TetR/AcrR family transcriptional regulator [Halobacillus andaensis]MBP2003814.1 AcrR family transcriptional regulator [Halobacillus andaensis]GGF13453.1 HTH-type transcriptional regulator PksA [Halobacillus andaensis]
MPKLVDHDKRKIQIAEATWKVIVEDGLEQATVRKIAKTAGLSVGALRHYFSTQSELLLFSMELVSERVKQRAEGKNFEGSPMEMVTEAICELLPVDEERRIEMEVWFVFSAKTLVDAKLEALSETVYSEMHQGLRNVIELLYSLDLLKENLDLDVEIDRLHALVDGMALHHLLHPATFMYEKMIRTLTYHIETLCKGSL